MFVDSGGNLLVVIVFSLFPSFNIDVVSAVQIQDTSELSYSGKLAQLVSNLYDKHI